MDYFCVPSSPCKPSSQTDDPRDTMEISSVPGWVRARVSALALRDLDTLAVARSSVIAIASIVASGRICACRLTLIESLETRGSRRKRHSRSYTRLYFGTIILRGNICSFVFVD
jgi:hypothetical protein